MTQKPRQIPLFADVPDGDAAVPYTYAVMREAAIAMARRSRDALVQSLAAAAIRPVHLKMNELNTAEAEAVGHFRMIARHTPPVTPSIGRLFKWAKALSFVADPLGIELVREPVYKGHAKWIGDCDDRAVVIAAACILINRPYRFISVSRRGDRLEHVFVMVFLRFPNHTQAVVLDPQEEAAADTMSRYYARWLIESYPYKEAKP